MNNENRVLACVDLSLYAGYVADYAAWAALRLGAPLEFLHVRDRQAEAARNSDHSGAIGVDAQQHLLTALSTEDEARARRRPGIPERFARTRDRGRC